MAATPRDLLKPYSERLMETAMSSQEQTGRHNGQQRIYGLGIERVDTNKKIKVTAGEAFFDGVSLPRKCALSAETELPAGAALSSGEKVKVLVEISKPVAEEGEPAVHVTAGNKTTGTPVLPELTAERLAVAEITLEGAFVVNTTEIPAEAIKLIAYDAGNVAPTSGF